MPFDPNKPFVVKKSFDPNKPFNVVKKDEEEIKKPEGNFIQRALKAAKEFIFPFSPESQGRLLGPQVGQFGPSAIAEELGGKVGEAGISTVKSGTEALAESKFGQAHPAIAAGIGTSAQMATEMAAPMLKPSGQAAYIGGELAGPLAGSILKNASRGLTKETLGMTRSSLTSTKSPFESKRLLEQSNKVADKMQDEGMVSLTGRPAPMIDDANRMFEYGKQQVNRVINEFEKHGKSVRDIADIDSPVKLQNPNRLDPRQTAEAIMDELKPKYDDEISASRLLLKDLSKHVDDGLTIREVEGLMERWGKKGFKDKTATLPESEAYRAGWKVLRKRLEKHFDEVAPELGKMYKEGKEYEEAALVSLRGLYNRQAALETTSVLEPFQMMKRVVEFGSGPASVGVKKVADVLSGPAGGLKVAAANAAGATTKTLQNPLGIVGLFRAGKISLDEAKKMLKEKLGL